MAKKRKTSSKQLNERKVLDPQDGKLGLIRTYEDVADQEDEFHIDRDKVLLDDGPQAKRQREWIEDDASLEPSDEEILGYSPSEDDYEEDDDDDDEEKSDDEDFDEDNKEVNKPKENSKLKSGIKMTARSEASEEEDEFKDSAGWGASKRDYYNTDAIETEADALEEEEEAKRLQQKKLQKMSEADFGFDEDEWLDAKSEDNEHDVLTEVLKDAEITSAMGPDERCRILYTRYPEFKFLADELIQLQPLLHQFQLEINGREIDEISSLFVVKSQALSAYIGSLTMYFAILTSTAKLGNGTAPLDPRQLRDHSVMESLLRSRELWSQVKELRAPVMLKTELQKEFSPDIQAFHPSLQPTLVLPTKKSKKELARAAAAIEAIRIKAARMQAVETEFADLSTLVPKFGSFPQRSKSVAATQPHEDDSDFGEESYLEARTAADKAQKKKSLRFYTSQIAQKTNRRADAGRDAGGDADLPYRERLRDRQARLNAEAEKRGKKLDAYGRGIELNGQDSGNEDAAIANEVRNEEDEYYDFVAQKSSDKKDEKKKKYDAIAAAKAANGLVRVVEGEVDTNGKRAIGYVIQRNKGLAPKRKKEVRNPRVKKRMKYEDKMKKLSSVRAVYKGGEGRGGYGGEKTGIKTELVKSIKL